MYCTLLCMVITYVSPLVSLDVVCYSGTGNLLWVCFIAKTANMIVSILTIFNDKYLDNFSRLCSRYRE